eukprot:6606267-Pyramimonas_sp.AAC.1
MLLGHRRTLRARWARVAQLSCSGGRSYRTLSHESTLWKQMGSYAWCDAIAEDLLATRVEQKQLHSGSCLWDENRCNNEVSARGLGKAIDPPDRVVTVSYTHLTLPTILLV